MRLAVVTSQYPVPEDPTRGQPVRQTIDALSRLTPLEVFVPNAVYPGWLQPRSYRYATTSSGTLSRDGYRVHHVTYGTLPLVGRVLNGRSAARALSEPLRRFAPDLVLAYWLYPDAYGASAVARRLGIPVVSGARGSDLRARDRLSLTLTRRALDRSAGVLAVSDNLRSIAVDRFRVPAERATTIANGCDSRIFRLTRRADARAQLGLPNEIRLVLFAGRLVEAKGVRELLTAWSTIAAADPTARLAFIGAGALHAELSETAASLGFGDRVLLPGVQPLERVAAWMQACDVFCLPSHTEGYPNVLVEALACGRPVVATPVGGAVEIVDERNGILTPVADIPRLTAALEAALAREWSETQLAARFSRSWDDVARETLKACESALSHATLTARAATRDRC